MTADDSGFCSVAHCAGETNNILNTSGGVFVVPGDPSDVLQN